MEKKEKGNGEICCPDQLDRLGQVYYFVILAERRLAMENKMDLLMK
jgi:hypothetical protein